MKTILGILGLIGALGNCFIAGLAWLKEGHSFWASFPWFIMGAIAAWICIEYIYQKESPEENHKKVQNDRATD